MVRYDNIQSLLRDDHARPKIRNGRYRWPDYWREQHGLDEGNAFIGIGWAFKIMVPVLVLLWLVWRML